MVKPSCTASRRSCGPFFITELLHHIFMMSVEIITQHGLWLSQSNKVDSVCPCVLGWCVSVHAIWRAMHSLPKDHAAHLMFAKDHPDSPLCYWENEWMKQRLNCWQWCAGRERKTLNQHENIPGCGAGTSCTSSEEQNIYWCVHYQHICSFLIKFIINNCSWC